MFTILSGASLGPEAPLVAICAATAGFLSRKVFKQKNRNVVRKHTFMGMAGALSAFFGVPLGGSLFSLEVASRFGLEYFEHLMEAIFAGMVCVTVFRSLAGLPLGAIWKIDTPTLPEAEPYMIVLGGGIGLVGAALAFLWANFHWRLMDIFGSLGLLDDENAFAVRRIILGACGVISIGLFVPQTLFWGEWEFPGKQSLISTCITYAAATLKYGFVLLAMTLINNSIGNTITSI
jgi:H+/Cl- antiporter ClcA